MDEIGLVVKRAARRIGAAGTMRIVGRALVAVGAIACLAILADRLFYLGAGVLYVSAAAAVVAAAAAAPCVARQWPSRKAAAVEIDTRLRLAERLSSALAVGGSDAPMAQAVVDDARAYARVVPLAQTFPIRLRREFLAAAGLAALGVGLHWWMPQYDLLARRKRIELARQERERVRAEAKRLNRELVQLRKHIARRGLTQADIHLGKMEEVVKKMESGDLTRAEAMAKLSELSEAIKEEEKRLSRTSGLAPPGLGNQQGFDKTRELAKALAARDLDAAKQELSKLADEEGLRQLSRRDREELAKELENLADQLGKEGAEDLAEAMKQAAEALSKDDLEQLSRCMGQCQLELDKQADAQAEAEALAAMRSLCKAGQQGLGQRTVEGDVGSLYTRLDSRKEGDGMKGSGIGKGGEAPEEKEEVEFTPMGLKGEIRSGRVVGSYFVNGQDVKAEAKAEYVEAVEAANREASRAIDQEKIPRTYEDYVRDYFHGMKSK